MFSIDAIGKDYETSNGLLEVIRNVSFSVEKGEFVSIVGPSGAGKTTLLRCMSGLISPSRGSVALNGKKISGPPRELACVFQDYGRSLMPWFKVWRNVELPLVNTVKDPAARRERVAQALAEVNLTGFEASYPWQLSGGMQQRVAIARGLAYQPEVLLMDEPFASVDAQTRADLEDLTLKVRRDLGITIVLVTHDIDEAVYLSDRVIVMSSRPTTVLDDVKIDLPDVRDQVTTKSLPQFAEHRAHVLSLIRGRGPADEDAAPRLPDRNDPEASAAVRAS